MGKGGAVGRRDRIGLLTVRWFDMGMKRKQRRKQVKEAGLI
jgi:hypothetical protein